MPLSNLTNQMLAALDKEIVKITSGVQRAAERPDGDLLFTNELTFVFSRGVHMGRAYALGALRTAVANVRTDESDRFEGPLGHLEVNEAVSCSLLRLAATTKNWQPTPIFGTSHVRYLQAGERYGMADVMKRANKAMSSTMTNQHHQVVSTPTGGGIRKLHMAGAAASLRALVERVTDPAYPNLEPSRPQDQNGDLP